MSVDRIIQSLKARIQLEGMELEEAVQSIKDEYKELGVSDEKLMEVDEAVREYAKLINKVETLKPVGLRGPRVHEPWYTGPTDRDIYWPGLKNYLRNEKGWQDEIQSIDDSSTRVISLLDNPGRPDFDTRGLVVGYVQSGKTANMTGVIAKAADTNFRFFIILSGLTDALRNQTQDRLEADLVDRSPDKWHLWTTKDADFIHPVSSGFPPIESKIRQLVVMKKNVAPLGRFLKMIRNTDKSVLRNLPILLIDDECDQASVNSSGYRNRMTRINELIRTILHELPRVAYIGYTATPFANVLIDPSVNVDPDKPDDLYPRDFIIALPQPEKYFGAEKLFGRDLLDADESDELAGGLDVIRIVPNDEIPYLRPSGLKQKNVFEPAVTKSLRRAILYFIMAISARCIRGDHEKHSSMLVHTTLYKDPHLVLADCIKQFLRLIGSQLENNNTNLLNEMRTIWDEEHPRVSSQVFGHKPISFESLSGNMWEIFQTIDIVVENSVSDERLNYTSVEKSDGSMRGKRYIVVGGSVLARGLTIEGLMVSVFVRSSSQYDTLMQMGRWFGYRNNYEDLPRAWMTSDLADSFRDLATVEAEIRYDIEVYEKEGITPLDFAIRIRQIPGMAITAKNKMLAAEDCSMSFSNEHVQTIKFKHHDRHWLQNNWTAVEELILSAHRKGLKAVDVPKGRVIRDVSALDIISFLETYRIHDTQENMRADRMIEYIHKQNEKSDNVLGTWNIGLFEPEKGQPSKEKLGTLGNIKTVNRSLFRLLANGDADIKALMSRADIMMDRPAVSGLSSLGWKELKELRKEKNGKAIPLLLVYVINRQSAPESKNRLQLDAAMDVIGVGIVFPKAEKNTPVGYKRVTLPVTEYEEPDEAELIDESEEAGE